MALEKCVDCTYCKLVAFRGGTHWECHIDPPVYADDKHTSGGPHREWRFPTVWPGAEACSKAKSD
jgi:hypothetical protein